MITKAHSIATHVTEFACQVEQCIPPQPSCYPFELSADSENELTSAIHRALYLNTNQPESTDLEVVDSIGNRWRVEVEPYDDEVAFVAAEVVSIH